MFWFTIYIACTGSRTRQKASANIWCLIKYRNIFNLQLWIMFNLGACQSTFPFLWNKVYPQSQCWKKLKIKSESNRKEICLFVKSSVPFISFMRHETIFLDCRMYQKYFLIGKIIKYLVIIKNNLNSLGSPG